MLAVLSLSYYYYHKLFIKLAINKIWISALVKPSHTHTFHTVAKWFLYLMLTYVNFTFYAKWIDVFLFSLLKHTGLFVQTTEIKLNGFHFSGSNFVTGMLMSANHRQCFHNNTLAIPPVHSSKLSGCFGLNWSWTTPK